MNTTVLIIVDGKIVAGESLRQKAFPEYRTWSAMLGRCHNKNHLNYQHYGALGITVCERWKKFAYFYVDMGPRPSPNHSIDRYPDMSGNYEPGNCRWATIAEQNLNRKNAVYVEFEGKQQRLHALAERFGIDLNSVRGRLRTGWSTEDALTLPVNKHSAPTGKNIRLTRKKSETTR